MKMASLHFQGDTENLHTALCFRKYSLLKACKKMNFKHQKHKHLIFILETRKTEQPKFHSENSKEGVPIVFVESLGLDQ